MTTERKYYKLIGCKVLERELASVSFACKNVIDTTMIKMKLHEHPKKLHDVIQQEIDMIDENGHRYSNDSEQHDFDAILLGYGLCSDVSTNISSKRYPIVIPRAHDCVTLMMGSKEAYKEYHEKNPGSYYYSPGYTEIMTFGDNDYFERRYQMYLTRYKGNERKANRAMEVERSFFSGYDDITFVRWDSLPFPEYEELAKRRAAESGWTYTLFQGNDSLLKKLVNGEWDEDKFLVVPPGCHAVQSYNDDIIEIEK